MNPRKARASMHIYHKLVERFARSRAGGWTFRHIFNPIDKRLMRWSGGSISSCFGTQFQSNAVLLRCVGAKSGARREIPLVATPFGASWILVASAGGHARNPSWYYNLKTHPQCAVLVPNRGEIACLAREAEGLDRERAWQAANAQFSGYAVHQGQTARQIRAIASKPS
jgi:deazaflavin-dependent oxidoreductase (nitroreductase family)